MWIFDTFHYYILGTIEAGLTKKMYEQLGKDAIIITECFPEFDESQMEILPIGALPFTSQSDENQMTPKFCEGCLPSLILKGIDGYNLIHY